MSAKRSFISRPFVWAAGLAMALGPLTALSFSSIFNGTAGQPIAASSVQPVPSYDSTRISSADYSGKMLVDVADSSGSLDVFSSVLQVSGVKDTLSGNQQFTVFIPVDEAFSAVSSESLSSILSDTSRVQALAKAHVVPGRVTATDLMAHTRLQALNGHEITSQVGARLTVNGANVIGTEVAENGIVHYVDRLL